MMKIGLIDVDGRHGKKKWGATVYPNVALGKIASWHTMQVDEVKWAQPYRDPTNPNHVIPKWQNGMAQWCNKRMIFCTTDFKDFMPRKGFRCEEYLMEYGMSENETEASVEYR